MPARRLPPGRFVDLGEHPLPGFTARRVRAYVPATIDLRGPHATLYLFDGQNVFFDQGSYAGGWYAHEAVDALGGRGTCPPVVVGISHGGRRRNAELGARAFEFLDALVTHVLPRVEARLGGGGRRVIGGSSLGGHAALLAWIHHHELFDGALAMSPSLWVARRRHLQHITRGDWPLPPQGSLYLDAGARERGSMFEDAELLAGHLATRGLGPDRLLWRPDRRGIHHERHWRRRLPKALRFLFGGREPCQSAPRTRSL